MIDFKHNVKERDKKWIDKLSTKGLIDEMYYQQCVLGYMRQLLEDKLEKKGRFL